MSRSVSRSLPKSLKKMKSQNVAVAVLLLVLIGLVAYFVMKNREGFNDNQEVIVVYFFYVDWCPHCKNAKPEMQALQQQLAQQNNQVNGRKVDLRPIDCEQQENKQLAEEHNVQGYPTIVVGNEEHQGPATQAAVLQTIEAQTSN